MEQSLTEIFPKPMFSNVATVRHLEVKKFEFWPIILLPRTLVQSAVLRSHVVCPSVRPSICPSVTLVDCDHRLEFFRNNFTIS